MQHGRQLADKNGMRAGIRSYSLILGAAALFVLPSGGVAWSQSPGGPEGQTARAAAPPPPQVPPAQLSTLEHVVRHFDFEEPEAAPNSLPIPFYRYIAPSQGFPPFGAMHLATGTAATGDGSFMFELGGGSMSARIPTAIVPVLPLSDYAVSVQVRTQGLHCARARLVAWLHDKTGQPIHDSRAQSRLIDTAGRWEPLTVEVRGNYPDAADLVLELQVVQPGQFNGLAADPDRPRLEDIDGRAWFDEVVVSHLPRVALSMTEPGNLVHRPNIPELHVLVNEVTSETMAARLRVFDLDGKPVYDSTFPAPRGRQDAVVRLPIVTCGWYRAVLQVVNARTGLSRQQWLDFTLLGGPESDRDARGATRQFGVLLPDAAPRVLRESPDLVSALRTGTAIVPVWNSDTGTQRDQEHQAALRQMIEQLLRRGIDPIFALDCVPDQLAHAANVQPNQVLDVLAMNWHLWQPYLDELLVNFGLEVNRWQVGRLMPDEQPRLEVISPKIAAASGSFAEAAPKPLLFIPLPIEQLAAGQQLPASALTVPYHTPPAALRDCAAALLNGSSSAFVMLEPLPAAMYSPHDRVADLMARGLHAWRAGLPLICLAAPWRTVGGVSPMTMPDPLFGAWRTLAAQLGGRNLMGELPLADGLHCWIIAGPTPADAALVAWSDIRSPGSSVLQSQIATGEVTLTDAFGNIATVMPSQGIHRIALSDLPVFVSGVNLNLVRFRGGITIEPAFVPAICKLQEHQIVLHNPWDVAISGTIRVEADEEWALSPITQEFSIRPGGQTALPLNIVPQRSILAGRKRIPVQVTLHADQAYSTSLDIDLDVGLKNIEMSASWRTARNPLTGELDLIITQAVTNAGDSQVNLDAYLLAPAVEQIRRTIARLGSGETALRSFHIANGGVLLAGQQVRVGVAERDGMTRLNRMLTILPLQGDQQIDRTAAHIQTADP